MIAAVLVFWILVMARDIPDEPDDEITYIERFPSRAACEQYKREHHEYARGLCLQEDTD